MEVQALGDDGKLCHILFMTARMGTDEVRDNLLVQSLLLVDLVKDALKLIEQVERWLAHKLQYLGAGMLRSHLQSAAHMLGYQLTGVLACRLIELLVLALVQEQVIAHTTSYKALLDTRQSIHGMVDVQEFAMVGIEVRADLWMHTRWALASLTSLRVVAMHAIHVG